MVIYILTKFGADWLIFVDARVLTRKLWTDRAKGELKTNLSFSRSFEVGIVWYKVKS